MGVGPKLLGRKVRCPHCKQIVLAPPPDPQNPGPPSDATPRPSADEQPFPAFDPARKECAESIMSDPDESEDSVFGSAGRTRHQRPDLTNSPTVPGFNATPAPGLGGVSDALLGSTEILPYVVPVVRPPTPSPGFGNAFGPLPAPAPAAPGPQPVPLPADQFEDLAEPGSAALTVTPVGAPVVPVILPPGSNPWGTIDAPTATVVQPVEESPRPHAVEATSDPRPWWWNATYWLAAYALIMTVLAVYGLFIRS
jgi:hypothetical protein